MAAFDFSVPSLRLEPPQVVAPDKLQLIARTINGTAVDSNRLDRMELRSATNLLGDFTQWITLTNRPVLNNGVLRIDNVDSQPPRGFFIINEP